VTRGFYRLRRYDCVMFPRGAALSTGRGGRATQVLTSCVHVLAIDEHDGLPLWRKPSEEPSAWVWNPAKVGLAAKRTAEAS